jgi:hypothetical protein
MLPTPIAPNPMLADLLALGVPRFGAGGLSLYRPDGTVWAEKVAPPVLSSPAGPVVDNTEVTITSATADALIYYTVNGDPPNSASTPYTVPVVIADAVTLKAIAIKAGLIDSDVASAAYTIAA